MIIHRLTKFSQIKTLARIKALIAAKVVCRMCVCREDDPKWRGSMSGGVPALGSVDRHRLPAETVQPIDGLSDVHIERPPVFLRERSMPPSA
jgi:hypothetical protein